MDNHSSIGDRIRYYRKRRGMPQTVLAGQVGRSPSWLTKVERGERVMDSISVLLELARVLKVEPGDIIGGISLPPNGGAPNDPPQGIPAIRLALFERAADREPQDAADLRARVERAKRLKYDGHPEAVAHVLPALLIDARQAALHEVPGGWWCLSGACQVASALALTVGEVELALLAADRAADAAQRSGDGLLAAMADCHLASAMLRQGWLDAAGAVCSNAADAIAPMDSTLSEGWSTSGLLQLVAAMASVRKGDTSTTGRLLRDARTAAERVLPGVNGYWESISPANVGAHEAAVALDLGDAVEALRVTEGVDVGGLQNAERRSAFCVHIAHAHALRRDDAATVLQLLEAERHAPEEIRYSVKARELVRVCLGRERKSRTPGLRDLAERIGVTV